MQYNFILCSENLAEIKQEQNTKLFRIVKNTCLIKTKYHNIPFKVHTIK